MQLPFLIVGDSETQLVGWVLSNHEKIKSDLRRWGAILLRGFFSSENDFRDVVDICCGQPLSYLYRSTPRTTISPGIYTATEYPAGLSIPMHNENAYQRDWPVLLFFYCACPAEHGGQTPLADTFAATNRIPLHIRQKFMEKQVMYIRNFAKDIDLSWQTVFQAESQADVEQYCRLNDIKYRWLPDGTLRTSQVCQSFAKDPWSGKLVWFNQAHLFHPSNLDERTRNVLLQKFKEEEFPRNAAYGDGSPIEEDSLINIRQAFEQETMSFEWEAGDLLMLANMRVSHGRTPFRGKRRVLAAMGQPYSSLINNGAN